MAENIRNDEAPSDTQDILRQIQAYIIERRETADDSAKRPELTEGRFRQVYDHLFQAIESSDKARVQVHARSVQMPVIGTWLTRAREAFHRLTVYYLDQLSSRQIRFNVQIAEALSALVHELDAGQQLTASEARILELEERLADLEARLAQFQRLSSKPISIKEPQE